MIVQNQFGGWGLSNAELAEATATAAQVLSGYTFYAGDKELKTGTLVPTPKVKTGTFGTIDLNETLDIECGFRPIAVLIRLYRSYSSATLTAFCYNGATYLTAATDSWSGVGYWDGTSDIRFSNTGFSVTNSSTYGNNMFPFTDYDNLPSTSFVYTAIG